MLQMLLVFKKSSKKAVYSDLVQIKCSQSLDWNANILLVSPYQN